MEIKESRLSKLHFHFILAIAAVGLFLLTTFTIGKTFLDLKPMRSDASNEFLSASPNPIPVCNQNTVADTTLSWTVGSSTAVELRKNGESGELVYQATGSGSFRAAGVQNNTTYYLHSVTTVTRLQWRHTRSGGWERVPVTYQERQLLGSTLITHTNDCSSSSALTVTVNTPAVAAGGKYVLSARQATQNYNGKLDYSSRRCDLNNPNNCITSSGPWGENTLVDGLYEVPVPGDFPPSIITAKFKPRGSSLPWSNEIVLQVNTQASARAAGGVRGVTFYFLNGRHEDFPWVTENLQDPAVRSKLDATLASYRAAGINWIRILVGAHLRPYYSYINSPVPEPSAEWVRQINDFLAITRSGPNIGKFKIEVVLIAEKADTGYGAFLDTFPYSKDKQWLSSWVNRLDKTNIGMILIGGDLLPCGWNVTTYACAPNGTAIVNSDGAWIKEVWPYMHAQFPNQLMTYESIAGQNNGTEYITHVGQWVKQNTPTVPYTAVSLYFDLPPGATWQQYANQTKAQIDAYNRTSTIPLWIDEYGKSITSAYNETDQKAFLDGFLAASVCWTGRSYPAFAWIGGYDYSPTRTFQFGLSGPFNGSQPAWRPAWSTLSTYNNLTRCP